MTECQNETMRDQLPLLNLGKLSLSESTALRAHVAACEACALELSLLERSARLFDSATPRIDTSALLAKLPAAPGSRPVLTVSRGGRRPFGSSRYALATAASLLLVATLSFGALRDVFDSPPPGTDISSNSGRRVATTLPVGLVGGNELSELGVDELETLLKELELIEATVAADPVSMQEPVGTAPEGL